MNTNSIHILRPRLLLAGSLALLSAAVIRSQTVPTPTLSWDSGVSGGVVTDSSGNGNNGVISGNVVGGPGLDGSSDGLTGFTSVSPASQVTYDTGTNAALNGNSATVSLWFENPVASSGTRAILFGIGGTASGTNRSAELWLTSSGGSTYTLNLGYQNWNGATQSFASSTFTIDPNSWYNLSFVWTQAATNGSDTQLYNVTVYLTEQGASGLDTTAILSTVVGTGFANTGPAHATSGDALFYVGANTAGYYSPFNHSGKLGGSIDDVSLWLGTALTADQLNSVFLAESSAIPEPLTCSLGAGACALAAAFFVRRRLRA